MFHKQESSITFWGTIFFFSHPKSFCSHKWSRDIYELKQYNLQDLILAFEIKVMFLVQLLHNFYIIITTFFLRSTIEYLWSTCRKTNLMIDHKKKKEKRKKKVV
jgi:putative effector of murein hydrolase LrgA (UPF0299 family)